MAVAAIATANLSKDYGLGRGLFELDLQVAQQEVFSFLGPNGAGKSTTIRCLMGLIRPTGGSAHIFGLDCLRDYVAVKRKVGYMPGEMPQFGSLRGSEVVAYLGALRGGANLKVVRNLAERFSLDLSRRYREYSSGNKRKLGIVIAFMHQPQLLILDEPTNGLDPLNQQEFFDLTTEARGDGATIFLSSHILSEVEQLCDRVGIIRSGRLVNIADLDELHRIRFYQVAGHTDAQRRAFGRSMSILAEQFTVILAPPMSPETVGGYVQWRAFGFLAILFAIWGLASASGAARGDEERGLVPAVLAAGVSKPRLISARMLAFALGCAIAALAASAGLLVGVATGGETFSVVTAMQAAIPLAALGICCFSLTFLLAQFASARNATAVAGVVLLALFLVNSLSRSFDFLVRWRPLSPFHYYELSAPLTPYGTLDTAATFILVALAVATSARRSSAFLFLAGQKATSHRWRVCGGSRSCATSGIAASASSCGQSDSQPWARCSSSSPNRWSSLCSPFPR